MTQTQTTAARLVQARRDLAREVTQHETITLYRANGVWIARFSDPEVRRLFATDTVPTAYAGVMLAADVLAQIQILNPRAIVTVQR